jgi:DNA ligase-associated metallophosphoesterase
VVVADVHLGKVDVFRRAGMPMPTGLAAADLARLGEMIDAVEAERLVVLGDLFHGEVAAGDAVRGALAAWTEARRRLSITLVKGNHDRQAWRLAEAMGVRVVSEGEREGPFEWRHDPAGAGRAGAEGGYVWAGHVHPAVVMRGWGRGRRGREKAACFWLGERVGVLPAFGRFTGTHPIRPGRCDRVWASGGEAVVRVH